MNVVNGKKWNGVKEKMINIEHKYNNIVLITDNNYTHERYPILKNLFKEYNISILDYEIRIKTGNVFEQYFDVTPKNLSDDFLEILSDLKSNADEYDEDITLELKILASME